MIGHYKTDLGADLAVVRSDAPACRWQPTTSLPSRTAEGMTTGEILVDFPQLTADDVREALQFAVAAVDQATVPLPVSA